MYCSRIRPLLEYASPIWGGIPCYLEEEIERVEKRCMRILGAPETTVEKLSVRRDTGTKLERILSDEQHPCRKYLPVEHNKRSNLRGTRKYATPKSRTERHNSSFIPRGIRHFNM